METGARCLSTIPSEVYAASCLHMCVSMYVYMGTTEGQELCSFCNVATKIAAGWKSGVGLGKLNQSDYVSHHVVLHGMHASTSTA